MALSRRAWLGVTLLLLSGCALVGLGAVSREMASDEPAIVRFWKLASKRLAIEGITLALWAAHGVHPLASSASAPYQEDPHHPYFARIRSDPRTAHFYASERLDLPDFAAMTDFLRDRFPHGRPRPSDRSLDVLELLDRAEAGAVFDCGMIAKMLVEMVQAGGGFGRLVQLDGHIVAELWSRDHEKWISMDPDFDVYFTSRGSGAPLSAYEIHGRVHEGRRHDLVPHVGASENALFKTRPEALFAAYQAGFAVLRYARWISEDLPRWHPGRSPAKVSIAYYPGGDWQQRLYVSRVTSDPDLLYAPPVTLQPGEDETAPREAP